MHLTIEELRLIIEALEQLDMEYGNAKAVALAEKIREERKTRLAEATNR